MKANIICSQIEFSSPEFAKALQIRTEVLRKPLGLVFATDELKKEVGYFHFVAEVSGQIVGTLMLVPLSTSKLKMRQVAVLKSHQGVGVGQALVERAEKFARENSYREIELHARDTAVPFYLKLGYEIFGENFHEVGILHSAMKKLV